MFDEKKARRVVRFIECLKHTKGEFHGKPFKLLPWQEKIIRDVFGTVRDEDPEMRQYNQVYIEIGKKNGKSELGAALALDKQKLSKGKELIRYFCQPCAATKANGGRTRNLPQDAPEKWTLFKAYNLRDVETEMGIQKRLCRYPVPEGVCAARSSSTGPIAPDAGLDAMCSCRTCPRTTWRSWLKQERVSVVAITKLFSSGSVLCRMCCPS